MPSKKVPTKAKEKIEAAQERVESSLDSIESATAPNTGAGFDREALPSNYSDEVINAKQAGAAVVEVIEDEWYGEISSGDPFYEVARPYIEANPDKHFRFLSDPHCLRRTTRGYQPVYDKKGRVVECAGLRLAWIPRHEYERRNQIRSENAISALKVSKGNYREEEKKAARDSGGAIEILPDEGERFQGNRRVDY